MRGQQRGCMRAKRGVLILLLQADGAIQRLRPDPCSTVV